MPLSVNGRQNSLCYPDPIQISRKLLLVPVSPDFTSDVFFSWYNGCLIRYKEPRGECVTVWRETGHMPGSLANVTDRWSTLSTNPEMLRLRNILHGALKYSIHQHLLPGVLTRVACAIYFTRIDLFNVLSQHSTESGKRVGVTCKSLTEILIHRKWIVLIFHSHGLTFQGVHWCFFKSCPAFVPHGTRPLTEGVPCVCHGN